ncbi:hypothetical protein Bca4012_098950 [Brassica carinata]
MSGEWCSSRQLLQANGGCYGAASCCCRQMGAAAAPQATVAAKSGCGCVSTKSDRAFRRLLPRDVEVAAYSQAPLGCRRSK